MDIFNRPPAISEDTLQYTLYPPPTFTDKASVTTFAACIQTCVESLIPGLIWHRDPFELKVILDPDTDGWVLEGRMRVGDCVDDEWCVVWLLKEVSVKWDIVISIFDTDGEFLLIEAAEALPSWVKPSNTENRVWIYRSHLHLVPLSHASLPSRKRHRRRLFGSNDNEDEGDNIGQNDSEDWIAAPDALKLVRDSAVKTQAPPKVEQIVWQRISGYPTAIRGHVHVTKAYIPLDIARALSANPSLVQKPIETFYTRDAIQLRAAHRMSRFSPDTSVLRTVKMTRTAYAQLVGQKFHPPKIFGRWQEKEGTDEWRWRSVGMKIACGFEMLYQETKSYSNLSSNTADAIKSSAEARKEALRRNTDYIEYIKSLVSVGYFEGELEGSQQWNILEDKAAATFVEVRRKDDATRPSFSAMVNAAVSQAKNMRITPTQDEEDSDGWLNVNAQDFDNVLEKTMGTSKMKAQTSSEIMDVDNPENEETEEDRLAKEQASRLQDLAQKVENFVEGEGDIEGARFEDEDFSDEQFSDEKMSDSDDDENPEGMDSAERQAAMDKLVPSLNPSEYGNMPASYHANSQRVAPTMETGLVEETGEGKVRKSPSSSQSHTKPIRQPILPRDKYDGVDSDDETDEEDAPEQGDESDEDQPQFVGEIEIDMGEEEEEFLEFSRQALGISDEQWANIVQDRKGRGAFLPSSALSTGPSSAKTLSAAGGKTRAGGKDPESRPPAPGPRPNINPNLDSFEAVMQAMDAELARKHKPKLKAEPVALDKGKGKAKSFPPENDADIEAAMDAELKSMLERDDGGGDGEDEDEESMNYNLIKNFLESFKSQGGLSGPVSNLAGRLQPEWQLPRDET